ncbi:6-bladed beta-propeller [Gaopeijia maritima]
MLLGVIFGSRVEAQPSVPVWIVGEDPAVWFESIGDVTSAADGSILVADPAAARVAVLSAEGEFMRWLGRSGQGPGEFGSVSGIVSRGDTVTVFDAALQRTASFLLDGTHLETRRVSQRGSRRVGLVLPMAGGAELRTTLSQFVRGQGEHAPMETIYVERGTGAVDSLASIRTSGAMWGNRDAEVPWGVMESGFGKAGDWATPDDSTVVIADGYLARVVWFRVRSGAVVRLTEVELPRAPSTVTPSDLEALEDSLRARRSGTLPRRLDIQAPPFWSVATGALADPRGGVWVRVSPPSEEREEWLAVVESGVRDSLELPPGFELRLVTDGLLVGRSADSLDVVRLVAYRRGGEG